MDRTLNSEIWVIKYLQPRFSHVLQIPIIQMHDSCNHETFIVTAGKAYLIDIQLPSAGTREWWMWN